MAYEPASFTEALDRVLGEKKNRDFSVIMLIGGKLRALYSEAEQPCPFRLDELLRALDEATEYRSSIATSPSKLEGGPSCLTASQSRQRGLPATCDL
jgi:hypothetical protein